MEGVVDYKDCKYFFLPLNPLCTTTTTSSSTTTTTTTSLITTTTTSTSSTTTTTTTQGPIVTTTTTTTMSPEIYGILYNWYAAADSRIVQSGWHVPTSTEWYDLGLALGGTPDHYPSVYYVSQKMKTIGNETDGTGLWKKAINPTAEGTNSSGLSINPAGVIRDDGSPGARTTDADLWCSDQQSATIGRYYNLNYSTQTLYRSEAHYTKNHGFSIRLIKDELTPWNPGDTYTDYDGNIYETVLMDDGKVWLKEHLRVQHFNDGSLIPTDPVDWSTRTTGAIHTYTV